VYISLNTASRIRTCI